MTKKDDGDFKKADRLKLSYQIFSDPAFREWLLHDPAKAAAAIGIDLPQHEIDEIRKHANRIRLHGQAIDLLVLCKKNVKALWKSKEIATFGINKIVDSGDWRANYPDVANGRSKKKKKK